MARKHKHEDHVNHEAWAIPYGDLLTLLLAFFVVMYAVSSVNEGRYRVLADSLSQAFGGPPKSMKPIQLGDKPEKGMQSDAMFTTPNMRGFEQEPSRLENGRAGTRVGGQEEAQAQAAAAKASAASEALSKMSEAVQQAMHDLISQNLVTVRRNEHWLEIEIRTDILFASGVAQLDTNAVPVLGKLAGILRPFDNPIRIEGHTDDRPIATSVYPSNWELSAARAASVVHLFMQSGVAPARMSVAGYASYRPVVPNSTADGRNRNRRVVVVVMAGDDQKMPDVIGGDEVSIAPVTPVDAAPDAGNAPNANLAP